MNNGLSNMYFQSINGIALPECATSLNCMLLLICVYSFCINLTFGHPTYWKKSSSFSVLPTHTVDVSGRKSLTIHSTLTQMDNINMDVLMHIFSFLSPFELTVANQVSEKFRAISNCRKLWEDLCSNHPTFPFSLCMEDGCDLPRVQYFKHIMTAMVSRLLDSSRLVVKIHGKLYDVSEFLEEHPGGNGVLLEYKGKDATRIFELASHSAFAQHLMENMLLFSPAEYNGHNGWPRFARTNKLISNS